MLTVALEDVGVDQLRREAQRLGIESPNAKDKDVLIREIRKSRAVNPAKKWSWSDWLSVVSIVVAVTAAGAAWGQVWYSNRMLQREIKKTVDTQEKLDKESWQNLVVFSIIEKGDSDSFPDGMTFDQIRSRYLEEANLVYNVNLGKSDIQPIVLRNVLFQLMRSGMVYRTHQDLYLTQRSELLPDFGRYAPRYDAAVHIVWKTSSSESFYTDEKLEAEVIQEYRITPKEFRLVVAELISGGYIKRDENGHLRRTSRGGN